MCSVAWERDKGCEWWKIASGEELLSNTMFLWVLGIYSSLWKQSVTELPQASSWKSLVQFEVQACILKISIKPESKNTKICLNSLFVIETLFLFFSWGGRKELPFYCLHFSCGSHFSSKSSEFNTLPSYLKHGWSLLSFNSHFPPKIPKPHSI